MTNFGEYMTYLGCVLYGTYLLCHKLTTILVSFRLNKIIRCRCKKKMFAAITQKGSVTMVGVLQFYRT